jgi:UDP-N-acetylglucosamine diphosphorylase/glucosamine-1-phosphate N-acetyltransferase
MIKRICIFEDQHYRRLLPLAYTRPVYELRCGVQTLRQKIARQYGPATVSLHCRSYLTDVVRQENPGTRVNTTEAGGCLFVNGRLLAHRDLLKTIPLNGPDEMYVNGDTLYAARINGDAGSHLRTGNPEVIEPKTFDGLRKVEVKLAEIRYPWDLVGNNGNEIAADIALLAKAAKKKIQGKVYPGAHLVDRKNIYIGKGSKIKQGVVLDAESGPIWIGADVVVFPNAFIEGPAFIGDRTLIKAGAKIYEDTSIGEVCKVGGEVEASIIHSYSNKQHDGFLGHAYLGKWVNLGADTNNSDLKNNYGNVKVFIDGTPVDTGTIFAGLIMGDHSKSSINSMFNTGTVVGVSSNVFGSGFPPKYVPSFAWGGSDTLATYDLARALTVAERVMARRKIVLSTAERAVLAEVYKLTSKERASFVSHSGE